MTSLSFRTKSKATPSQGGRFAFVRAGVIFAFFMLGARLVWVQGILRSDLQAKAERQLPSRTAQQTDRFEILDTQGRTLAETVQVFSCFMDPSRISDKAKTAAILAQALDLDERQLLHDMKTLKGEFAWVKRSVPPHIAAALKEKKLEGVGFKKEWRRSYPMGPLASQVMGLVGYDGRGLSGIEMQYEDTLRPKTDEKSDTPTGRVKLSIDADIQLAAEKELEWGVKKINAKKGMVVVQNPATGEILAMASWPPISLSPDRPPKPTELRIPPVVDVFEPGSTFKVVAAAAAIEEKVVSPTELFSGEQGKWKVCGITIHDHEPQKYMTLRDILTYSSNIGIAKVSEKLGGDRLFQYARLFGFGVFPGSGLPAEAKGTLRVPAKWSGVSKYVISFGQEVGVTALQLADAYSAIANGGTMMEPSIVNSVIRENGDVAWTHTPAVVRRVISPATAKKMTEILTHVVEAGTGQNAQIQWRKDLKVAGKTGTAQKFDSVTGKYDAKLTLVSFAGFFPADAPKFTMVVILDEPEGRRWGGADAAPVFRRIAEQLSPKLSI